MRTRYIILSFSLFFSFLGYSRDNLVKTGQSAPDFTFSMDNIQSMKFSDIKGKVVLINFFATWCPPCKKELPQVKAQIWDKYKNNKNFVLLTFGRGHTIAEIEKFKLANGIDLPLYIDTDKSIYEKFATDIIPRSYLVDKNGVIVFMSIGYSVDDFNKLLDTLDKLLKE